jgi:hypothetical protein
MQTINETAVSSIPMEQWDFHARIPKIAARKVGTNGITISSYEMNRNKLVASACAEFRDHYTALLVKRDDTGNIIPASLRIPSEYYDKAVSAVDAFIKSKMDEFLDNPDQLAPVRQRFVHQAAKHTVIIRHTMVRNEIVSLQKQHLGIVLLIGETNRLIKKYDAQKAEWSTETCERVNKLQARLAKEELTLAKLDEEIAKQKTVS